MNSKTEVHTGAIEICIPTVVNQHNAIFHFCFYACPCHYLGHDCFSHLCLYEKLLKHKTQLRCSFLFNILDEFSPSLCSYHLVLVCFSPYHIVLQNIVPRPLPNVNMNSLEAGNMFFGFYSLFIIVLYSRHWIFDFKNVWMKKWMNELFLWDHTNIHSSHVIKRKDSNPPLE